MWAAALMVWVVMLAVPASRTAFIAATGAHPYMGGFVKFAILASMGDLLGARILNGEWNIPKGFLYKAGVWGVLGLMITLVFTVYTTGVAGAMAAGRLPFEGSKLAAAFFASFIMNVTFGPMLYMFHKFGDLNVDIRCEKKGARLTVKEFVDRTDWYTIVGFSWLKIQLFVWIPFHTFVFMLPGEYRVLASAFASILLGVFVAASKKSSTKDGGELAAV